MIDHDNLEEFQDGANYDIEEAEESATRVDFFRRLAQESGGPVLEIACGTGLITLPGAVGGLDVTGLACRFTYPQELAALLWYNGFRVVQQYGDWNYEVLTATSLSLINVCRHRQDGL